MALRPGSTLGPYEILSLIGAGGMGEVYRARDPRLNREVAIKVLPADRIADDDRRRRFVQEAHAASALNHPHIITIYEIESANGIDFIVMEYIRGKSLDALIPRHGMRLGEVLRIAIPVADALAAAHARGIIHRDLKPANVMVGTDGDVKVLDFGLAKLIGREDADEAQLTHTADMALSVPGMIAGTAAYMSPEQATGEKVDARSDIFSFGAMLYEMVTGVSAFAGSSGADTLSAVLRAQPKPPTAMVQGLPTDLEKAILRCLRKDPERRFQHMADMKVALQEIKEDSESGRVPVTPAPRRQIGRRVALAASVLMAGGAVSAWLLWRSPGAGLAAPRLMPLTTLAGAEDWPTFSPDGDQVAFEWTGENNENGDIYVTIVGSTQARRLTTDPARDYAPSWSPDGRQIAFLRDGSSGSRVYLISALGGADMKLSDFPVSRGSRLAWTPDNRSIAVGGDWQRAGRDGVAIYLIPVVQRGEPRAMTRPTRLSFDYSPAFSPDGRRLAYASCVRAGPANTLASGCHVHVVDVDTAFTVTSPVHRLTSYPMTQLGTVSWTRDGTSVIFSTLIPADVFRVGADGDKPPERIELVGPNAANPATVSSRDRLAFAHRVFTAHLYRFEPGHSPRRMLASSQAEFDPQFSRDGHHIAFASARSGELEIWVADANGTGVRQFTEGLGQLGSPHWSPDDRSIAFDVRTPDGHYHIWTLDAEGGTPRQLTRGAGNQTVPTWSQDGRWVYFSADLGEGGPRNIWRLPATGGAPEQVRGQPVDHRADIFAFGAVLYEMLSGQRAFQGDTPADTMSAILHADPRELQHAEGNAVAGLNQIIRVCLEKDPSKRFQSSGDIILALDALAVAPSSPQRRRPTTRRWLFTSAAGIVIGGLAVGAWWIARQAASDGSELADAQASRRIVAVLPFKNVSADAAQNYFSAGITEEIRGQLSKLSGLRLLSRSAVERYNEADVPRMAQELGAGSVVEGSVRLDNGRVRIAVQLIDARNEQSIWAEQYDRQLNDIFAVQSDVALRIAGALQATLSPDERRRVEKRPTENLAAYELYLKSQELPISEREQNVKAIEMLRQALELDPQFAVAQSRMAYRTLFRSYYDDSANIDIAIEMARKAIALDPALAQGHVALASAFAQKGQVANARLSFLRAMELDPNSPASLNNLSILELDVGRYDEALMWTRRAFRLAPNVFVSYYHVGVSLVLLGNDHISRQWLTEADRRFPGTPRIKVQLAALAWRRGDEREAEGIVRELIQAAPKDEEGLAFLAEVTYLIGAPDSEAQGKEADVAEMRGRANVAEVLELLPTPRLRDHEIGQSIGLADPVKR